jgi:tetratricopeptide (TPR) repeat protein
MRVINAVAISSLILIGALGASAKADDDADRAEAKKLFERAEVHYAVGRFREALEEYSKAYEMTQLPGFLFNIGQCHKELGDDEKALFFYEGYLRAKPNAKNRRMVEDLILEAKRKIAQLEEEKRRNSELALKLKAERLRILELTRKADESPPKGREPVPQKPIPVATSRSAVPILSKSPKAEKVKPVYEKWWFWTIIGGAVAAAAGGAIYALSSGGKIEMPSGSIGAVDLR